MAGGLVKCARDAQLGDRAPMGRHVLTARGLLRTLAAAQLSSERMAANHNQVSNWSGHADIRTALKGPLLAFRVSKPPFSFRPHCRHVRSCIRLAALSRSLKPQNIIHGTAIVAQALSSRTACLRGQIARCSNSRSARASSVQPSDRHNRSARRQDPAYRTRPP